MRPDRIANLGIARTFQNIELFAQMTVLDNLMLGRHRHVDYGTLAALVRVGKASREEARNREVVEEIVEFLELQPVRKSYVGDAPLRRCRSGSSWAGRWPWPPGCCCSTSRWPA